jgi:HK97 family phage portal protein
MGVSLRRLFGISERVRVLTATDGRDILLNDPAGWEVQQPWLWWDGPAGGDGTGGPFGNPPPGADYGGRWLASVPGVSFCTSLISSAIAGMPWQVFRGWEQLPTPAWLTDPQNTRPDGRRLASAPGLNDVKLSAVEFYTEWITSALWWGDGYIWSPLPPNADGSLRPPMWILNPNLVSIDGDPDNRHYYVEGFDGEPVQIPAEQLIHLRGEPPYSKGHGHGVLTRHLADLGLAAEVRRYAYGQYRSGVPAGYIESSQPNLTKDKAAELQTAWMAQHGGARRIAVLNATTKFVPLNVTPLDAQLDLARTWALRDIAMSFHIPPFKLGVPGDTSTYANVESRNIDYRADSLMPWVRRIESCLDAQFPLGTELRINTDSILRADMGTRFGAYNIGIPLGIYTRDEARAKEGLPPLGAVADPQLPTDTPPSDGTQVTP